MKISQSTAAFIEKTDFSRLPAEKVQSLSLRRFEAIGDALEDGNHHSEFVVFAALRTGNSSHITQAREILTAHHAAGYLTGELYKRRTDLCGLIFNTPAQPAPPALPDPWEQMAAFLADYSTALENCRALDDLGEPFPDLPACLAAGQSAAFLAATTGAALAEIRECETLTA